MFDLTTPAFLQDLQGKASMMRAGALVSVAGGVAILVGGAFGFAGGITVTAEHALWLVGLGLLGKVVQRGTEAKQAMSPNPKEESE